MANAVRYRVRTPKDTPPLFCHFLPRFAPSLRLFICICEMMLQMTTMPLYWLKTALNEFDVFPLALFHADHRHVQKLTENAFWYKND